MLIQTRDTVIVRQVRARSLRHGGPGGHDGYTRIQKLSKIVRRCRQQMMHDSEILMWTQGKVNDRDIWV